MNNLQKILLLKGLDFPKYIKLNQYVELYFNDTQYIWVDIINKLDESYIYNFHTFDAYNSRLKNIAFLKRLPTLKIKTLYLAKNKISNIKPLLDLPFDNLEELILSTNNISDISTLYNLSLPRIQRISLVANPIQDTYMHYILLREKYPGVIIKI